MSIVHDEYFPPQDTLQPPVRSVLILKPDRDGAASIRRHALTALAEAVCTVVGTVADAKRVLATGGADMVVTGLEAPDGDVLDLLWRATAGLAPVRHSLVVTRHTERWPLLALRSLPIGGVFDTTTDHPDNIAAALRMVAHGGRYCSPALTAIFAAPDGALQQLRLLSPTERLVFAAIAVGRDAKAVSTLLGMRTASIASTLKHLHRKLGVHHHGELLELAARLGFVRFAPAGSIRVGFGLLLADYYARCKRPLTPTAELRAEYPQATTLADCRARCRPKLRAA